MKKTENFAMICKKGGGTMVQDYIAVFDSGVGGASVLRQLRRLLPGENFYYFGDSANAPYGTRTTQEVRRLTLRAAAHMLRTQPVKALVVACNTATAAAIACLRETYPELIVIGIEPAIKPAFTRHPGESVGIMATEVTLREEKLAALLRRLDPENRATRIHVPGLVELVERGITAGPELEALLAAHLSPYRDKLSALVLGCTHYPLAADAIGAAIGSHTELLDGGEGTARETRRQLLARGLLNESGGHILYENSKPENIPLMKKLTEG